MRSRLARTFCSAISAPSFWSAASITAWCLRTSIAPSLDRNDRAYRTSYALLASTAVSSSSAISAVALSSIRDSSDRRLMTWWVVGVVAPRRLPDASAELQDILGGQRDWPCPTRRPTTRRRRPLRLAHPCLPSTPAVEPVPRCPP